LKVPKICAGEVPVAVGGSDRAWVADERAATMTAPKQWRGSRRSEEGASTRAAMAEAKRLVERVQRSWCVRVAGERWCS
jgi:hypothetical protein